VDVAQVIELVWVAVSMVLVVLILVTRRARRHGAALRAGIVGAMYEWHNKDKQRALDVIVEGKAAARRPEYPDGSLPDPDPPKDAGSSSRRKAS
jgi:hypothetical protein